MKPIAAAMAIGLALACGGPREPDPAPDPTSTPQPPPAEPQPPPPANPQPTPPADPQPPPTPPPADPQPQPPAPEPPAARCFLEDSGHGTWNYRFTGVEGSCEWPGHEFTSDMPPGTSFLHTGPIPPDGDRWHCETQTNVVSSDKCNKVITRHCWAEDVSIELVDEFQQVSATKVTFSLDEQWETGPMAGRYTCHARYHGVMEKQ